MSISQTLNNANSGLSAASLRANIASNNIANANSPGYVNREADVSQRAGGGVRINGVTRNQDFALTAERRTAEASVNKADVLANAQLQISRALGDPESGFGLFNAYQTFENTLSELAATPESAALQDAFLLSANDLAADFNTLQGTIDEQRMSAEIAIGNAVETINTALADLKEINRSMASIDQSSNAGAELEDRRQQLLDEIGRYVPIKAIRRDNAQVDVMTTEGISLLSGGVLNNIEFSPTQVILPTDSMAAGNLSGLSVNGLDITPGGNGRAAIQSGALAGYFSVRDEVAPGFQEKVDALAADVITRLQDPAIDPTLLPGDAGLFTDDGGALAPDTRGLAGRIAVNAAVDPVQGGELWRLRDGINAAAPGAEGDGTTLGNMLDALTTRGTGLSAAGIDGSFSMAGSIAEVNSVVGQARTRAEASVASATARAEILSTAELEATAVDTDTEMQNLLLIEQAYAANARVIQTVQNMMQSLLEL